VTTQQASSLASQCKVHTDWGQVLIPTSHVRQPAHTQSSQLKRSAGHHPGRAQCIHEQLFLSYEEEKKGRGRGNKQKLGKQVMQGEDSVVTRPKQNTTTAPSQQAGSWYCAQEHDRLDAVRGTRYAVRGTAVRRYGGTRGTRYAVRGTAERGTRYRGTAERGTRNAVRGTRRTRYALRDT